MDLLVHGSKDPRYSFYSIDRDPPHQMPYAVFIVPQGRYVFAKKIIGRVFFFLQNKKISLYFTYREAEWLFSTREGRSQLANSTQVGRLLVVIYYSREIKFFLSCISRVIFTIFFAFFKGSFESRTSLQ